jgi:hypothetical protein
VEGVHGYESLGEGKTHLNWGRAGGGRLGGIREGLAGTEMENPGWGNSKNKGMKIRI